MGLESLPLVVFLLLPGFLSWFIFCWGTVTRKISSFQHLFVSLTLSIVAFTIAYYVIYFFNVIAINTFAPLRDITRFPKYMQILSNPDILPPELGIAIYLIAIILGFLLIIIYRSKYVQRALNRIGLDLYGFEDAWYRAFRKYDYITVYLKDGNILSGWPTYFSQTGGSENTDLYLTKIQYYQKEENRWVRSSRSVEGLLINTDSISHIEFRKPDTVREPETMKSQVRRIGWPEWVERVAKYYVWAFGITLTHLAVLREIITLPQHNYRLIILLFIFDAAVLALLSLAIYRNRHKKQ